MAISSLVALTPEEQAYLATPEGQLCVARAKRSHEMREAHKGAGAIPWDDTRAAAAIRKGTSDAARAVISAEVAKKSADYREGELVALRVLRAEARAKERAERSLH